MIKSAVRITLRRAQRRGCIADIAQPFQGFNQAVTGPQMQADGGSSADVEDTHQAAARFGWPDGYAEIHRR